MTSYRFFQDGGWQPYRTTLDNPRSAIVGLKLVLKFGLDQIHSFGDIVIFIFCRFGLKLPIHAHFWGFAGHIFPRLRQPSY